MSESIWSFLNREHPALVSAINAARRHNLDTIDSSKLGPSRRYVWECIRKHLPETAALLVSPDFLDLKGFFGATIEIEMRVICRAIAKDRHAKDVSRVAAA